MPPPTIANVLFLPKLPKVRMESLIQTELVPLTITVLLLALGSMPMDPPSELATLAPLVMKSLLNAPEKPTTNSRLFHTELAPRTVTALLLAVGLTPM